MTTKKIIRILEYVGDERWLKDQMARNGVQGTMMLNHGNFIREVYRSPAQDISESIPTPFIEPSKEDASNSSE